MMGLDQDPNPDPYPEAKKLTDPGPDPEYWLQSYTVRYLSLHQGTIDREGTESFLSPVIFSG